MRSEERCRACLGMGYKGRWRPRMDGVRWVIETCRACGGSGSKAYARPDRQWVQGGAP